MDDYIFIIIAIALAIVGAINKNKKRQAEQMNADQAAKRQPSVFDQFFDDPLFGEHEQANTQPELQPRHVQPMEHKGMKPPTQMVKEKLKPSDTLQKFKEQKAAMPKRKIQTSFLQDVQKDEKEDLVRGTIMEDFSLRRAFVYSEILKRKY